MSSGQPFLPIVFYSVVAAGGVFSTASSAFTVPELVRQIKQGHSRLLVCSPDLQDVTVAAAKQCGIPLSRVLVMEWSNRQWTLKTVDTGMGCISDRQLQWERITDKEKVEKRTVALLYSSGTTGVPKGRNSYTSLFDFL